MTSRLVAVCLLAFSHLAVADPDVGQAEVLFRQGRSLMAAGKYSEACIAFETSQKLDPSVATLLNLGDCREKNGQLATAWSLFLEAERQSRSTTDEFVRSLHSVAVDHATRLEPNLSTLSIVVAPEHKIDGLQIKRGPKVVDPGSWGRPLPIDGGTYAIVASAPRRVSVTLEVTVAPDHDAQVVEIPELAAVPIADEPTPLPTMRTRPVEPPPPVEHRPLKYPLLSAAGGAVALAGTIGFELWAESTYDASRVEVDNAKQAEMWKSANHERYAAEAFGVLALGGAGLAVWLYLRPLESAPVRVTPTGHGVVMFGEW